jgi:hypothetical protein
MRDKGNPAYDEPLGMVAVRLHLNYPHLKSYPFCIVQKNRNLGLFVELDIGV